ncbi:MAG: hypothetical protein ABSG32_17840 [Terriglobia bacterium]|jgi:hypothetical protein
MKGSILIFLFAGLAVATARGQVASPAPAPGEPGAEDSTPEAGGEHLRVETEFGPLHLWRPANYEPRTAGMVVYVHGYYTSADQTWADDHLATQFRDSGRNALFLAIEAPPSSNEDVFWKSLEVLLRTVEDRIPFPLPRGPLVVVGHSGSYRTILLWLHDPRVQYVILLDGLYGGLADFRDWLRPRPRSKPHRMVLVSSDTWRQSSQFARRIYGTARRGSIPAKSSSFTPRETHAPLLYLRSQYDHAEMITSGKVIPVLLQITPIKALATVKPQPTEALQPKPTALVR